MRVEQLIKELKKYPPNAKIAMLDHDHDGEEHDGYLAWNGPITEVNDAPPKVKSRGYQVIIR